jgi:large subunit ribosomal protein L15
MENGIRSSSFSIQNSSFSIECPMSMIHEITALAPRNKRSQRKGRGESSGRGKTSGKGTKGSKARVGKYIKRGYEGGQTPLFRRWPKRGFSNANFERRYFVVNLSDLERFPEGSTVDAVALIEAGLVPDDTLPVKVLANGEFNKKLTIVANWYSRTAHQKIAAVGGTALNLKNEAFEFPKPKKKFVPRDPVKKKVVELAPEPAPAASAPAAEVPAAPAEAEKPSE